MAGRREDDGLHPVSRRRERVMWWVWAIVLAAALVVVVVLLWRRGDTGNVRRADLPSDRRADQNSSDPKTTLGDQGGLGGL
jgi:hypothetical protein